MRSLRCCSFSPKSVSFLGKRSSHGAHEKTGLKPVFDSSVVCCDVVRHKGLEPLTFAFVVRDSIQLS